VSLVDLESKSEQGKDITDLSTILVALIPPKLCLFAKSPMNLGKNDSKHQVYVNPKLQLCLGDQSFEIDINDEREPIKPRLNDSSSRDHRSNVFQKAQRSIGKTDELSIKEVGRVSRVFCHTDIDQSIIRKLKDKEGTSVTTFTSDMWEREIKDLI
jgi:hypothetical protein